MYSDHGLAPTISTKPGGNTEPKVSVIFDTSYIGQDGKARVYENICPTLTSRDYKEPRSCGVVCNVNPSGKGRVGHDIANTLDTSCNQGIFVQVSDDLIVYAIWYEKYQCYIAIRKLTPKECFRLQGWTDDYFEKAEFVNSDSQLYKQAGNGVTVNVIEAIAERMETNG